jgi:hypothetical protein
MKRDFENRLNAVEAVLLIFANNVVVWSVIAVLSGLVDLLKAKVQLVRDLRQIQEADTTGITARKNALKGTLITKSEKVIKGTKALAVATDNQVLLARTGYTHSDLTHASDNELADITRLVYETALPLKTELGGYLVNDADIELVTTLQQQFLLAIPGKRGAVAESAQATQDIEKVMKEMSALLREKIDILVAALEPANPAFYEQYRNARTIVDMGGRHEKPEEEGK